MATQQIPLMISVAPFPEGWQGDIDEHGQQLVQLMEAYVEGNFLVGLILPPGSTLPTTDQGPIAMGGQWYFYDPVSGQYLLQAPSKVSRNCAKNPVYQIQQLPLTLPYQLPAGAPTNTWDMVVARTGATANVLQANIDVGPAASPDNDYCPSAIKYTVTPQVVATLASSDLYAHEHLIEGSDIQMLQGEPLTLAFSAWANAPGVYSAYLTSGARDVSYTVNFTVTTPNVWQRVKIPDIPAIPVGTGTWTFGEGTTGIRIGVVMALGGQYQTAQTGKWLGGFFAGTSQNLNMCGVLNNQLKISGVKFEGNTTATYLSVNPFEGDYFECIRYYFTTFNYQSLTAGLPFIMQSQSNNNAIGSMLFGRRMCKAPSVVPYGWTSHAAGNVTDMSNGTDVATASLPAVNKGCGGSIVTTGTKGDTFACLIVADARLT